MQVDTHPSNDSHQTPSSNLFPEYSLCKVILRNSVWLLGILTWLFGVLDRGYVTFTEDTAILAHVAQLSTAVLLFGCWLYLKPEGSSRSDQVVAFQNYRASLAWQQSSYLCAIESRMEELQQYHLVGRDYVLPFPYPCQIYHLLNLKHLETVHSFSLNNLKVLATSDFQPTEIGGKLRFQTSLESPLNVLRFWRQPEVEAELTLYSPFSVELQIPVHNGRSIHVIFNVLPLNQLEHRFFVDIYSNLRWPKPLLRYLLGFATSLTLLEDLPYLRKLTSRKHPVGSSHHAEEEQRQHRPNDMMQLYHRYVHLYSLDLEVEPCDYASLRSQDDFSSQPISTPS